MPIELNQEQQNLRHQLEVFVATLEAHFNDTRSLKYDQVKAILKEMGAIAHQLHMSLTPHPTHHRHMIENRGNPADHPQFYEHYHPVQDLLAYLDDPTANDDPVDQTIGARFNFHVYTRRWGHEDAYELTRTATGWDVRTMAGTDHGDLSGSPALENSLVHDSVSYPRNLGNYMEWLWVKARDEGLEANEVQARLDEIAAWVSTCERSTPNRGLFQGI